MKERKQSSTSYPMCFLLVSSTDHVTPITGITPTVTISKNGGAFASPSGAVTEIGSGWYQIAGNATDRATLGELLIHATGTGADPVDDRYMIVAYDPFDSVRLGLTALPNAAADAAGGLPISDAGGLDLDSKLANTNEITTTRMGYVDYLADATYGLSAIETLVDELESRLTAQRASNLDELGAANIPSDIDTLLSRLSALRAGYLDKLNITGNVASSGEITALNDISVADILAGETESGLTLAHAIQLMTSALALKASGGGTTTVTFRNYGDTKNRITMTVDENGNRSEVVVSLD